MLCGQLTEKQFPVAYRGRCCFITMFSSVYLVVGIVLLVVGAVTSSASIIQFGAVIAGAFLLLLYLYGVSLRRRIRQKWGIPSAYGIEALGCDDICCPLFCAPCSIDQVARQEYLASNGHSVEYDFYSATGVVPGVQYAQPPAESNHHNLPEA